jgi:mRNA interferase RelE/StbE
MDRARAQGTDQNAGKGSYRSGRIFYGSLAANPYRVGEPLKLGLSGVHRARRGDYRISYRIDDPKRHVEVVLTIEHRSDAYRPR